MSDLPPVVVILQTYQRTEYALKTIKAARERLLYPDLLWYVADDGSDQKHFDTVMKALKGETIVGSHNEKMGYGATANRAFRAADALTTITLWLEDDWETRQPFPLENHVRLLLDDDNVGMVRLAQIPIDLEGITCGFGGEIYLRLYKTRQYYFSGNPSLRHRRFFAAYNLYPEGLEPGATELAMDKQVQEQNGPDILIPVDVGSWGAFGHIGAVKSYEPA